MKFLLLAAFKCVVCLNNPNFFFTDFNHKYVRYTTTPVIIMNNDEEIIY